MDYQLNQRDRDLSVSSEDLIRQALPSVLKGGLELVLLELRLKHLRLPPHLGELQLDLEQLPLDLLHSLAVETLHLVHHVGMQVVLHGGVLVVLPLQHLPLVGDSFGLLLVLGHVVAELHLFVDDVEDQDEQLEGVFLGVAPVGGKAFSHNCLKGLAA